MLSLHPPHLKIKHQHDLLPSSLIPICTYQQKEDLGSKHKGLNFTACNAFQHSIHQGQLCYSLKLDKKQHGESKVGIDNGLILIIDPEIAEDEDLSKNHNARILLDTLSPISDSRSGDYALSNFKWMNGTESFMKLSNEEKDCQIESFEDCQREKIAKQCGCVPWQLKLTYPAGHQVRIHYPFVNIPLFLSG